MAGQTLPNFTFTNLDFVKNPFDDYVWLRDEHPVYKDPVTGFYVISRYEDVRKIAMSPAEWSSRAGQIINRKSEIAEEIAAMYREHGWMPMDTLVTNDPPAHKRYRALVDKAFSPARVKTIQPFIESIVEPLANKLVGAGPVDFMQTFAIPLTMSVIATQLGVDPADMADFRRWTDSIMEGIDPTLQPDRERSITRDVIEMQNYLARSVEKYRATRGETILSDLVYAEVDGERLSVQEIIAVATLFLGAGNDTTTSALGSAVLHLARHPVDFDTLRSNPGKIPIFIEEVLRLYAPVQRLFRRATQDVEIAGTRVPEGSIAVIQWGAANRDERRFGCPHQADLERADAAKHFAFGSGIHFCIGNQLARAELRIAIAALVARAGTISLARGEESVDFHEQIINLSPSRLEVVIDPR